MTPLVPRPDAAAALAPGTDPQPGRTAARIREQAREFEALFLGFLIKTMRRTVPEGPAPALGGGNRAYKDLLDEELARAVAKGRGIGLADILVRDLTRKNSSSLGPEGPMANRQ